MKIFTNNNGKITEQNVDPGAIPAWFTVGTCLAAFGNGDPVLANWHYNGSTVTRPTPTEVTTSVARCVKFRLPKAITPVFLRVFSVAATTGLYKFAIYNSGTGAKVWDSGAINTVAGNWNAYAISSVTLDANTDYWLCMTVVGTGTTAAFRTFPAPIHANYFGAAGSPIGNTSIGLPIYAQFAVTGGVFPSTLPALAAAAYSGGDTGTIPLPFLTTT